MPQIAPLPLTVGTTTVNYVPAGTQNGDKPSMYTTVGDTLSLDQQDTLSHLVSQGSANRIVRVHGVKKKVSTAEGIEVVSAISSFDLKLTYPKATILADRIEMLDLIIAYITDQKEILAKTEVYY